RGRQGRWEEAVQAHQQALRLQPQVASYHCDLAFALYGQGQTEAARAEYDRALRLRPDWPGGVRSRAWELAAGPRRPRNPDRAAELAAEACQATGERRPEYLETLAVAQAAGGRFSAAADTVRKALARAERGKDPGLVRRLREQLRLYRSGRPA